MVADDEDLASYLARLEEAYDDEDAEPTGRRVSRLIEEVERFLRDQTSRRLGATGIAGYVRRPGLRLLEDAGQAEADVVAVAAGR